MITPMPILTQPSSGASNMESLGVKYTYGSTVTSVDISETETKTGTESVQGDMLKWQNQSSGGFKFTLTALVACHVKGQIAIGSTVIETIDGDYPAGDIKVYTSSTTSGTLNIALCAYN